MPTYRYIVTGRVQGVLFRHHTALTARRLGICGTVQNLADGSVEVVAQGKEDQLRKLEEFLDVGPPAAEVHEVTSSFLDTDRQYTDFSIVYF